MKKASCWSISMIFLGGMLSLVFGLSACSSSGKKYMKMEKGRPYGSSIELKYADKLWSALEKSRLVGEESFNTTPIEGHDPHGVVVEILSGKIKVVGFEGDVYVLKNYGGKGVSRSRVAKHRSLYLKGISVMMKRRHGYDLDNKNWYWADFNIKGKVKTKTGDFLNAGRVAKGEKMGCISCHGGAPGGDYIFSNTAMQLDRR